MTMNPKFPLHFDLEVRRLLNTLDTRATPRSSAESRQYARQFTSDPELTSAFANFDGYHDFPELRKDAIGKIQRAARSEPYSVERFDVELSRLLAAEQERELSRRANEIMQRQA